MNDMREFSREPEKDQPPERTENQIKRAVWHDFYISFPMGQGSPREQALAMKALAGYYSATLSDGEKETMLRVLPELSDRIENLHNIPPHRDELYEKQSDESIEIGDRVVRQLTSEEISREFSERWDDFCTKLHESLDDELSEEEVKKRFTAFASCLIKRDLYFIIESKRASHHWHDPHASFFRKHVIQGEKTGSEAFDDICTILEEMRKSGEYDFRGVSGLRFAWEEAHPGQSFFDDQE